MGTKEKFARVGTKGSIFAGGLKVDVEIVDYKFTYGRDRWQVKPIAGDGLIWVESVSDVCYSGK
jgi:hypothetical protein